MLLVVLHKQHLPSTQLHLFDSLKCQIPLTKVYGITPDISIIMTHTFYQSVYYASHNHSFPSTREEKTCLLGWLW